MPSKLSTLAEDRIEGLLYRDFYIGTFIQELLYTVPA